ncbi:hypothetical protein Esi_0017_0039 [Ectocarpus siliculosus]|uniref:Uncharacterized protein n=1 Tax=Ectocarpus siliculosus TaxID=2880 RepID=D7FMI6_ECTSI|nr:hypothetical protein Esi_0017_0039 [Ectocarpus siliculosus]|eukprot:CBJ25883.1 hypothetical protein Esi_0017_0039 [Ectocarpus siliculosus]
MFSFGQHVRAHVNSIEERQRRTLSDVSNSAGNANNESSGRAARQPQQQQQGKNNPTLETQEAFLQAAMPPATHMSYEDFELKRRQQYFELQRRQQELESLVKLLQEQNHQLRRENDRTLEIEELQREQRSESTQVALGPDSTEVASLRSEVATARGEASKATASAATASRAAASAEAAAAEWRAELNVLRKQQAGSTSEWKREAAVLEHRVAAWRRHAQEQERQVKALREQAVPFEDRVEELEKELSESRRVLKRSDSAASISTALSAVSSSTSNDGGEGEGESEHESEVEEDVTDTDKHKDKLVETMTLLKDAEKAIRMARGELVGKSERCKQQVGEDAVSFCEANITNATGGLDHQPGCSAPATGVECGKARPLVSGLEEGAGEGSAMEAMATTADKSGGEGEGEGQDMSAKVAKMQAELDGLHAVLDNLSAERAAAALGGAVAGREREANGVDLSGKIEAMQAELDKVLLILRREGVSGERDAALEDPGPGGGAAQGAFNDRPTKGYARETATGSGKQKQSQGEVKVLRSCHKRRDQVRPERREGRGESEERISMAAHFGYPSCIYQPFL